MKSLEEIILEELDELKSSKTATQISDISGIPKQDVFKMLKFRGTLRIGFISKLDECGLINLRKRYFYHMEKSDKTFIDAVTRLEMELEELR